MAAAAAAGGEESRRTAALLSVALEPAARLAIMNALSDLAAEVTAALNGPVVTVRLDGRDVAVGVDDGSPPRAPADPPMTSPSGAGDVTRITLRLFEELKGQAEQAAARQGVSLNTWLGHAVRTALHEGAGHGGHHGGGWHGTHWNDRPGPDSGGGTNRVKGWVRG